MVIEKYLGQFFKPVKGIRQYQDFPCDSNEPGIVTAKETCDETEEKLWFWKIGDFSSEKKEDQMFFPLVDCLNLECVVSIGMWICETCFPVGDMPFSSPEINSLYWNFTLKYFDVSIFCFQESVDFFYCINLIFTLMDRNLYNNYNIEYDLNMHMNYNKYEIKEWFN